jgi:hypothetical protein
MAAATSSLRCSVTPPAPVTALPRPWVIREPSTRVRRTSAPRWLSRVSMAGWISRISPAYCFICQR